MSAQELVGFLQSPNPEIVKVALENILPFTPAQAGQQFIFKENDFQGARTLKKLSLQSTDAWTLQNAIIALINLSDDESIRADLASDSTAVTAYAKSAAAPTKLPHTKYICMLLSNLARESNAVKTLRGPLIAALVFTSAKVANIAQEDYDFLAFVFSEFARIDGKAIAKLIPHLYGELINGSLNRRKGVAATIKNTLFESDVHEPLANDTPLIDTIMLCLQGPEPLDEEDAAKLPPIVRNSISPTKQRESDVEIQVTLIESLLLLSSSQAGRSALRLKSTYFIVRELHKSSTEPEVVQLCENFVNMVMRGDPKQEEENKIQQIDDDDDVGITEVV